MQNKHIPIKTYLVLASAGDRLAWVQVVGSIEVVVVVWIDRRVICCP